MKIECARRRPIRTGLPLLYCILFLTKFFMSILFLVSWVKHRFYYNGIRYDLFDTLATNTSMISRYHTVIILTDTIEASFDKFFPKHYYHTLHNNYYVTQTYITLIQNRKCLRYNRLQNLSDDTRLSLR